MASVPKVSDKNRYGLKPIAEETKAHMLTLLCVVSLMYDENTLSNNLFRIQYNPSDCFIDPTATRIKFQFTLDSPNTVRDQDTFLFERGLRPLIRCSSMEGNKTFNNFSGWI